MINGIMGERGRERERLLYCEQNLACRIVIFQFVGMNSKQKKRPQAPRRSIRQVTTQLFEMDKEQNGNVSHAFLRSKRILLGLRSQKRSQKTRIRERRTGRPKYGIGEQFINRKERGGF